MTVASRRSDYAGADVCGTAESANAGLAKRFKAQAGFAAPFADEPVDAMAYGFEVSSVSRVVRNQTRKRRT